MIQRWVGSCPVFLALIGPEWLQATDDACRRRLDDPDDYVRLEIETALKREVPLIPVLLGGAQMPTQDELPPSLAPLAAHPAGAGAVA